MKLVWSHDAVDLVASALIVEMGDAGPEARDLEHQLGAVKPQKLDVVSDLKVLPDVIGDGAPHVALQVRVIRHPALRARVQIEFLRFFLSVAPALPREHGSL